MKWCGIWSLLKTATKATWYRVSSFFPLISTKKKDTSGFTYHLGSNVGVVQSNACPGVCVSMSWPMCSRKKRNCLAVLGDFLCFNVCRILLLMFSYAAFVWSIFTPLYSCETHKRSERGEGGWTLFFPKRREIFNSVCRQLSRQHTISFLIYYFFILPSMERNKKWLRNRNIKTYSSFWVWVWHFFSPVKKKLYRCLIYRENSWLLAVNKPRTKKIAYITSKNNLFTLLSSFSFISLCFSLFLSLNNSLISVLLII